MPETWGEEHPVQSPGHGTALPVGPERPLPSGAKGNRGGAGLRAEQSGSGWRSPAAVGVTSGKLSPGLTCVLGLLSLGHTVGLLCVLY